MIETSFFSVFLIARMSLPSQKGSLPPDTSMYTITWASDYQRSKYILCIVINSWWSFGSPHWPHRRAKTKWPLISTPKYLTIKRIKCIKCSLPPSWKGLRQGWHSLACIVRWPPRVPWTPPDMDLYLNWNWHCFGWIVCSLRLTYCSGKASANPAICIKFLGQTKVDQLHPIILPVTVIPSQSTLNVSSVETLLDLGDVASWCFVASGQGE